jgi:hypothetical protein
MAAYPSSATAQELLGYWKLEETDVNQEAVDSSGKGLNGIYEGDVEPNVEGAPGFGMGARFDGITSQILIGPGDETGFGDLTSNFSVMAWIYPEQFTHKNRVFGSAPHGGAGWGWGTNSDQLEITTWAVRDYDQAVPLELEEWTHAAIVLDENFEAHFYVNGELIGSQAHDSEGIPTFNDFYIGYACCEAEHFEGRLDEVAVFSGTLSEQQIVNAMNLGANNFNGMADPLAPLNDGTLTDPTARANYVHDTLHTWIGDSNLDGQFNSGDLVIVFQAGQYEDTVQGNSSWVTGDWNGDKEFSSGDLVVAFQDGGFEAGPRPAAVAVPEPSALALMLIAGISLLGKRRWDLGW